MSIRGYVKKSKPAAWTQVEGAKLIRSPEKREKKIKPRKRLNFQSEIRTAENRAYCARVKIWIQGKICKVCGAHLMRTKKATECHHSHGRRGKLLLYEPFWIPVCRECHNWIHNNPEEARALNLICGKGQWNQQKLVRQ